MTFKWDFRRRLTASTFLFKSLRRCTSVFFPPKCQYIAFPCRVNSYSWWEWWPKSQKWNLWLSSNMWELDWVPLSPRWLESFCGCRDEFPCLLYCPFSARSLSLCTLFNLFTPSDLHSKSSLPSGKDLDASWQQKSKAYTSEHIVFAQKIARSLKAYF